MKLNQLIVLAATVSWYVSGAAWAVPPVNDDCDTGAIEITGCVATTDVGNCAKNKASWCSPLFSSCGTDGLCIPIWDAGTQSSVQYDCAIIPTDNREATTWAAFRHPYSSDECSENYFGSDVWWKVEAPCRGKMNVTMCGGGVYDAMLAAYDECPNPLNTVVVIPLACNNDSCGTFDTVSGFQLSVEDGQEVTIRVGGWAGTPPDPVPADEGQSQLHVRFACYFSPPEILPGEHGFSKDRYISWDPAVIGTNWVATKVTRAGSATEWFVDCTSIVDLGSDGHYARLIPGPLPSPSDATYYCDMSSVSQLHIRGCNVVPGNMYDVSMTTNGTSFTSALSIPTTPPQFDAGRSFGDYVGGLIGGTWTAPDGLVTANDIVATAQKFALVPTAPLLARMDNDGIVPNGLVNGGDILRAVNGFAGESFGFNVTDCLTGTCVPPQGGACE